MTKSELGLVGLGVMGKSLAINLANREVKLSVFNRHVEGKEEGVARSFLEDNPQLTNLEGHDDVPKFVNSLEQPRKILLMVSAGIPVDDMIEQLVPHLDEGDIIIDGGNSHFIDTNKRTRALMKKGIEFIGTGISGGEEGARKGPSIMPGGSKKAYDSIGKYLEMIAARDKNGDPCCAYIGPEGAGHFVKMIHNGIEYADMQLIAEIYHVLRFGAQMSPEEIATLFKEWASDGLNSYLLEITIDILKVKEGEEFLIDLILDAAGQKGTGGWSTAAALSLGVPLSTISESVMARNLSGMKAQRMKAQSAYQDSTRGIFIDKEVFKNSIKGAYQGARIVNHAIGIDAIQQASTQYNWSLNLSGIARLWTNGCIIRSELMEDLSLWLNESAEDHLLLHPKVVRRLSIVKSDMATGLAQSIMAGFSMPVLSAATNYFLSFISGQSSANIIQAQRDYFGAHTYRRKDADVKKSFHTDWKNKL